MDGSLRSMVLGNSGAASSRGRSGRKLTSASRQVQRPGAQAPQQMPDHQVQPLALGHTASAQTPIGSKEDALAAALAPVAAPRPGTTGSLRRATRHQTLTVGTPRSARLGAGLAQAERNSEPLSGSWSSSRPAPSGAKLVSRPGTGPNSMQPRSLTKRNQHGQLKRPSPVLQPDEYAVMNLGTTRSTPSKFTPLAFMPADDIGSRGPASVQQDYQGVGLMVSKVGRTHGRSEMEHRRGSVADQTEPPWEDAQDFLASFPFASQPRKGSKPSAFHSVLQNSKTGSASSRPGTGSKLHEAEVRPTSKSGSVTPRLAAGPMFHEGEVHTWRRQAQDISACKWRLASDVVLPAARMWQGTTGVNDDANNNLCVGTASTPQQSGRYSQATMRQTPIPSHRTDSPPTMAPSCKDLIDPGALIEDLKQAILGKFGSLHDAFRWFDFNGRGIVSRSMWTTGLKLMHADASFRSNANMLFKTADTDESGEIQIEEWMEFFGCDEKSEYYTPGSGLAPAIIRPKSTAASHAKDRVAEARTARDDSNILNETLSPTGGILPSLSNIMRRAGIDDDFTDGNEITEIAKAKANSVLSKTDQHRAEELVILEDIQRLDLKGIRALAYIFAAKCGSLDAAFTWLDCTCKGYFARVHWQTALLCMHIDMEELTGLKPNQVFMLMGGRKGRVTKKMWDAFFAQHMEDDDKALLRNYSSSFQSRTTRKLKQIWKTSHPSLPAKSSIPKSSIPRPRSRASPTPNTIPKTTPRTTKRKEARRRIRPKKRRPSLGTSHSPSQSDSDSGLSKSGNHSTGSLISKSPVGHSGELDRSQELCYSSAGPPEHSGTRLQKKASGLNKSSADASDAGARLHKRSITPAPSKSPNPTAAVAPPDLTGQHLDSPTNKVSTTLQPDPPSTRPTEQEKSTTMKEDAPPAPSPLPRSASLEEFERTMLDELISLGMDESMEYKSLGRNERQIIQELCASMRLFCQLDGEVVTVYRPGPKGLSIKQQLEGLGSGERLELADLQPAIRQYARSVAEELELFIESDKAHMGEPLVVFNFKGTLEEFSRGVNSMLRELAPGEVIDFPEEQLSKAQQDVVRKLAGEFGYQNHLFPATSIDGYLSVGNLTAFEEHVRQQIDNLSHGGLEIFGSRSPCCKLVKAAALPPLARLVTHTLAAARPGCVSSDVRDGGVGLAVKVLYVAPDVDCFATDGGKAAASSVEMDIERMTQQVTQLFSFQASGHQGRSKIFLKKPDIFLFATNAAKLRNRKLDPSVLETIENIYDDTLELQVDIGSRVTKGITCEYFQVFLSKSAQVLGWSLGGLLMTLLRWYEE